MGNNKYKNLVSNTVVFAISNVLSKVILALLLPLYTHILSPAEYGIAELLTTIIQFVLPIVSLAINNSIVRFAMAKDTNSGDVLKSSLKVASFSSIAIIEIAICLYWYTVIRQWRWYFCIISILMLVRSIFSLYSKGINKTIIFSIDAVLYNFSLAAGNVLFLLIFGLRLDGYFDSIIIANVISIIYLIVQLNLISEIRKATVDKVLLNEMLKYSAPLVMNSISWGLTSLADKTMLSSYHTTVETGIYSAASKIPSLLSLVTGVITQAWGLSVIEDYETDKDKNFYKNVFEITHIATILCALIILTFNNNIIPWVLGENFSSSAKYSPVLLLGTVFLTYSNFFGSMYSAIKMSKQMMYSSFGGAILNVILNYLLIPRFSIMGACIATCASYIYIAIFRMINSQRYINFDLEPLKLIISLLVTGTCTLMAIFNVKIWSIVACVISIIIIYLMYRRYIIRLFNVLIEKVIKGRV